MKRDSSRVVAASGAPSASHRRWGEAGFTLIELSVVAFILALVLIGAGNLFEFNTELARVQMHLSDMQQSARIAQRDIVGLVRMAGRGGLPVSLPAVGAGGFAGKLLPTGPAIEIANDVADNTRIVAGDGTTPLIVEGTDVLTIRGVFNSSVYQVSPVATATLILNDPNNPTTGTVKINDPNPVLRIPQALRALEEAITTNRPEALLLISPLQDIYAIVEITGGTVVTRDPDDNRPTEIDVDFRIGGTATANGYLSLSPGGGFSTILRRVAAVGLVEEYRYFVREERAIATDANSELRPRLTRARFYPGTDLPWDGDDANLRVDVADNIVDLQLAFGIDTNADQVLQNDDPSPKDDDWLFDDPTDDASDATKWNGANPLAPPSLYYLRISTLTRSERRDRGHVSPAITTIEDNAYGESASGGLSDAEMLDRTFHRSLLTTTVDLRNL